MVCVWILYCIVICSIEDKLLFIDSFGLERLLEWKMSNKYFDIVVMKIRMIKD